MTKYVDDEISLEPEQASVDVFVEGLKDFPTIYVEVNNHDQIARIYFEKTLESIGVVRADLRFTYPGSVDIAIPEDTKDIKWVLDTIGEFTPVPMSAYGAGRDLKLHTGNFDSVEIKGL